MTNLNNTARTILRSRVRRHPDVDRHVQSGGVSGLSNADLVQVALLLGLDVPGASACSAYDAEKRAGRSGAAALAAADASCRGNGCGGDGFKRIAWIGSDSSAAATAAAAADEDEALNGCNDDDSANAFVEAEMAQADDTKAKAAARVKEIQGKLGAGDFAGYLASLTALAEEACKPAPAPVAAPARYFDPSRIKGHVPQVLRSMTMGKAGIVGATKVSDAATALDVYDAPDAPAVDPAYIWPDHIGPILSTLASGDNVFLWGPAGTGKTTLAQQIAARWGRPFVRISCDDQTEAATLMGQTVPAKSGGTEWQDGQLAAAIRRPGTVILVDEPTVARAGALFVLQAVLDGNRALHVPDTGEVIPVAPGVLFLLADNTNGTGDTTGQYEATRVLNRATLDRLAITVRLDYLTPQQEATALVDRTGIDRKRAAALAKFAALTRTKADAGEVSHGVGLRRLLSLAKRIREGVEPAAAFQLTVIETAPFDDREPLRQLWASEVQTGAL